jgi:hypothetical protein
MKRREFITLLGSAAASWPIAARAQEPERTRRIGLLMSVAESDPEAQDWLVAFREGLPIRTRRESRHQTLAIDSPGLRESSARNPVFDLKSGFQWTGRCVYWSIKIRMVMSGRSILISIGLRAVTTSKIAVMPSIWLRWSSSPSLRA